MNGRAALLATGAMGLALLAASAPGAGVPLATFLTEVEEAARSAPGARADLQIRVTTLDAPEATAPAGGQEPDHESDHESDQEGVVISRSGTTYVELRSPPVRVVIPADDTPIRTLPAAAGAAAGSTSADDPLGDTPLIVDDFRSFRTASLRMPQVTSETKHTLLVSAAPATQSPWVLLAIMFDREKLLARRVQYYERTISNLVRVREASDFVRIGGVWHPGHLTITDYRTRAVADVTLRWTADAAVPPGLFDASATPPPPLLGKR